MRRCDKIFPERSGQIKETQIRLTVFVSAFLLMSVLLGIMYGIYRDRYYKSKCENEFFALHSLSENIDIIIRELSDIRADGSGIDTKKAVKALEAAASAENDILLLKSSSDGETAEKISYVSGYLYYVKSYIASRYKNADAEAASLADFGDEQTDMLIRCGERLNGYFMLALDYLKDRDSSIFKTENIIEVLEEKENLFLPEVVSEIFVFAYGYGAADLTERMSSGVLEKEEFGMLEKFRYVSASDAGKKAEKIFGENIRYKLSKETSDVENFGISPEIYRFYCENAFADITVSGGYLIRMNFERGISPEKTYMSEEELLGAAREFLFAQKPEGYEAEDFRLSGYIVTDGRMSIKYAYAGCGDDNISAGYITVGVMMDSGKVYSYDACDFFRNG